VYEITRKGRLALNLKQLIADSFNNVKQWLELIDREGPQNIRKIILGNKSDITDKREVTYAEAKVYIISRNSNYRNLQRV
jgi:GTPase SAR1 family protein